MGRASIIAAVAICAALIIVGCSFASDGLGVSSDPAALSWKRTLGDLGYSEVSVPTDILATASDPLAMNKSIPIPITLPSDARQDEPADARQNDDQGWILYASFILEFEPDSGPGWVQISADVNDHTSIQLIVRSNGSRYLAKQLELINGSSRIYTLDHLQVYDIANYAQTGGIKPGQGRLTFKLRIYDEARVKRLVFLEDTALIRIPLAYPTLRMEPFARDSALAVGREFALDLRLTSLGWPVKSPKIRFIDPNGAFRVESTTPEAPVDVLSGRQTLRYALTPLKAGEHPLYFSASTANAGNPKVRLITNVHERDSVLTRLSRPPLLWLALTGFSTVASWTVFFYVRRTTSHAG